MSDELISELHVLLLNKNMKIATAESCTGGLLASLITQNPGASQVFDRGFITYTNKAKSEMLDVPAQLINEYGAVSAQVAETMANGALKNSQAGLAVSITGIAGPDGGTNEKPVGTVFFGYALKGENTQSFKNEFTGSRQEIQTQSAVTALKQIIHLLAD